MSRNMLFASLLLVAAAAALDGSTRAEPGRTTGGLSPHMELKAGVAVADITPPPDYRMSGYFAERISTGTHDPLNAKAIYLGQGDQHAVLVFCDLVGVPAEITNDVREAASEKTGIAPSSILVAATHSHTGPLYFGALRRHFHDSAVAKNGSDPYEQVDYPAELADKLVDVICRAKKVAAPARLLSGTATQNQLPFNRRFHMKDGAVVTNPGKLNPNIVRPAGPIDPDANLLFVRNMADDKPLASLTVFSLHLDTVGGTEYAADFPYYLEQAMHGKFGGDFVSIFGAGPCDDINHIDVSHDRPQKGHEEAKRIGDTLAETVLAKIDRLAPVAEPSLAVRNLTVEAPLQRYTEEQFEKAMIDLRKIGTNEIPMLKLVEAYKIVAIHRIDGDKLPMEVQAFRVNDELAIVGLPGEIFVELGLAIKKASPFKTTIVIELCNDAPGYVPTRKAFEQGGYETINSRVQAGGGELLVETAIRLLKELKSEEAVR